MKPFFLLLTCLLGMKFSRAQSTEQQYPVYKDNNLGLQYSQLASVFTIWAPGADSVQLQLYHAGWEGEAFRTEAMQLLNEGAWQITIHENLKGLFYTFRVRRQGKWSNAVPDPYAKAVGVNGKRAAIIDLYETNPDGWIKDKSPAFSSRNAAVDAVIYELHTRDASMDKSSGIKNKGLFKGLTELNTKSPDGSLTGLSHLKELGVTHIHLLPFFDYNSVDESKPATAQYNWGYDPLNYNVPEGSYSSNPFDPAVRIKELKQMIVAFHKNGLRVVMDVVYNHVANAAASNFEQLVPGYYFRHKEDGKLSDATACGNETASEQPMMRKFIIESLLYWLKEYHVDGFRFDLMGVHDIETMNMAAAALRRVKPDILLYGEGWTAGGSPVPDSLRALKKNAHLLHHVAVFSDDIRDGIKGSVFEHTDRGFASGKKGMEESIKFGVVAACEHPQIDLNKVNYSRRAYAAAPWNTISYCECHDNHCLWDKLSVSCTVASENERIKMQQLALTIVLTSQGIPFLHAGTEFLRTKKGVENSFNAGDSINAINWLLKKKNARTFRYVQSLITLRKEHPAFRMTDAQQVKQHIRFDDKALPGTVVYTINGAALKDNWKKILVVYNGNQSAAAITVPPGNWKTALGKLLHGKSIIEKNKVPAYSALIMYMD